MFNCSYCNKEFNLKQNVKRHESTCKMNENNVKKEFLCEVCNKTYTTKWYYEEHVDKCKPKKKSSQKVNEELIKELKQEIKREIQDAFNNKYEIKNVYNVKIKNYVQKKVYMNGLEPIDLSQDRFDNIVDNNYTYEVHKNLSFVPNVIVPFFSNEKGDVVAELSDRTRMKLKCINSNNLKITYHDPQSIVDMCKASKPLIDKRQSYVERINNEEKYMEHMDVNRMNLFICTNRNDLEKSLKKFSSIFNEKNKKDAEELPQPDEKGYYFLDQLDKVSYKP
jgi:hypothetical protein